MVKKIEHFNNTMNQLYLVDIYRILHAITAEYISFSSTHGTFPKTDLVLGHKIILNKFIFLRFYLFIHERQRHRKREKQAPCREPNAGLDVGLNPQTWDQALSQREMLNR